MMNLSGILTSSGRAEEGLAMADAAIRENPRLANAHSLRASALQARGRLTEAEAEEREAETLKGEQTAQAQRL